MDAMDAILSRRSIRKYTAEPVPEKLINELLEAAMSAPSSDNGQPWHFVVIDARFLMRFPNFIRIPICSGKLLLQLQFAVTCN